MGVVGNIISADQDPAAGDVMMSNGLTSVFLDVLVLSGSDLARTVSEVAAVVSLRFPASACPQEPFESPWSTLGLRSDRVMCRRHAVYLHNLNIDHARCCQLCNR
jgi:hypothetical protein